MFGGLGEAKAVGRSGRTDKRVESSSGEWSGGNKLDSCCLFFREIPSSVVPTAVWGETQPGVFEVLLCYYMDESLCAAIIH